MLLSVATQPSEVCMAWFLIFSLFMLLGLTGLIIMVIRKRLRKDPVPHDELDEPDGSTIFKTTRPPLPLDTPVDVMV